MLDFFLHVTLRKSSACYSFSLGRYDVYMGIDVFGRGTWGGGGFDVDKALGKIARAGVSAALFAPSWTMEDQTTGSFFKNFIFSSCHVRIRCFSRRPCFLSVVL